MNRQATGKHFHLSVDEVGCWVKASPGPTSGGRRRRAPEVSQTGVLPHLVRCLPQMVGLGGSHVEDVTLIRRAFTGNSGAGPPTALALSLKEERRPKGVGEISTAAFAGWYHNILTGLQVYLWHSSVWLPLCLTPSGSLSLIPKVLSTIFPQSFHPYPVKAFSETCEKKCISFLFYTKSMVSIKHFV